MHWKENEEVEPLERNFTLNEGRLAESLTAAVICKKWDSQTNFRHKVF